MPDTPPPDAARLEGRFRLEACVGRGGMGEVWRARDLKRGEAVAVKRVLRAAGGDRARLLRETEALRRLSHDNVVRYLGSGFDEADQPYLVLEWLEGEDLARRQVRAPLSLEQALAALDQVLIGLQACHAQGVVHRDLKLSNVFLTADGRVKLIDFGLAWLESLGRLTRTGMVVGSLHHLAPEQLDTAGQVDERTDVYAAGVLLYQLATLQLPFPGEHPTAVLRGILSATPSLPSLLREDLPPWLDEVVLRAMRRAPQDRYPSAVEMRRQVSLARGGA
jgi:eukaryotic-like serine/threonine-protein kinase